MNKDLNNTLETLRGLTNQFVTIEYSYQPNLGEQDTIEVIGELTGFTKDHSGIYFILSEKSAFDAEAEGIELGESLSLTNIKNVYVNQ